MTQPTALFLADILEDGGKPADIAEKCAAELRRLHAELERCKQVCAVTSESWRTDAEKWKAQREPLTEEEISNIWDGHVVPVFGKNGINPIVFARAIERAHGIGDSDE